MVHKHREILNNRNAIFSLCEASCEAQFKPDVTSFFVGWCIYTGSPHVRLEYEWKIKLPLSRVFCGGLYEFLIRARGKLRGLLVGGLEPRSRKTGTRKFLGGSDRSPKIIKWQGMKLLTFFVACLCQLGGTEVRCEEETGSQNACTNLFKHIFLKQTKKTSHTKHETHNIPL